MEIDQLRAFLAVLDEGSFSRAGQALGIGQSTVSFHIQALERAVGAQLVDRGAGAPRATAAGGVLRPYARRLLALRDEALSRVHRGEMAESGHVVVAASTVPAEHILPAVLAAFRRGRPGVTVSVRVSDSRGALAALLADACDLALVGARPADRRVRAVPFADDEVLLVGPTSGPYAVRGAATRARLAALPLVLREEGSGTRRSVDRLVARLRDGHDTPAPIVVGSSEMARRCVLAGAGISFLSRHAVDADLRRGSLRRLPFPGTPARRRFYAAWPSGATLAPAARALRDELLRNHR